MLPPVVIFALALVSIFFLTVKIRVHPFFGLLATSILVAILTAKPVEGLEALLSGMARVVYHLGIILICGIVIGAILEGIGGTSVIAGDIIRVTRKPLLALNLMGFLAAVPLMSCISAYVIFMPIAKEVAAKLKIPIGVAATSLCLGTLASYELIYPAPGVYSAAAELGVAGANIVLLGLVLGIPTTLVGYFYASRCKFGAVPKGDAIRKSVSRWRAYPPIIVPLALIFSNLTFHASVLNFLGNPNIALLIGALLALIAAYGSGLERTKIWMETAMGQGGAILMVVCAGGGFGATLAMTGVGQEIGEMLIRAKLPALLVPFLVAVAIQSAQGSRLVTFLVVPSLILPVLPELGLPPEIVLLSVAAGTFLVSHANDSYFWTVLELADLKEPAIGYKCYTVGGVVMGLVAISITAVLYLLCFDG